MRNFSTAWISFFYCRIAFLLHGFPHPLLLPAFSSAFNFLFPCPGPPSLDQEKGGKRGAFHLNVHERRVVLSSPF